MCSLRRALEKSVDGRQSYAAAFRGVDCSKIVERFVFDRPRQGDIGSVSTASIGHPRVQREGVPRQSYGLRRLMYRFAESPGTAMELPTAGDIDLAGGA